MQPRATDERLTKSAVCKAILLPMMLRQDERNERDLSEAGNKVARRFCSRLGSAGLLQNQVKIKEPMGKKMR